MPPIRRLGLASVALTVAFAACSDAPAPMQPDGPATVSATSQVVDVVSEMMALPRTVYGGLDEASGQLVFGVEDGPAADAVRAALEARGLRPETYRLRITEPIHFASNLRGEYRPAIGGLQLHWSNYVCTLGFNTLHSGGASFVTNSHCTEQQGTTGATQYYQPLSSVDPTVIAVEADDPGYFKGGECTRGKKCRYSDASRAVYQTGIDFASEIARPSSVNDGNLDFSSTFDVAFQDAATVDFSGEVVNKVGRTTGWTTGTATNSCVTVNVSGSNIQLLCQTFVENPNATIVQGGDSGSPVFRQTGASSAELVGILWGGNSSGSLFVFSPLKQIQDELGSIDAVGADGTGDGGSGGGNDGGDGGGNDKECPPNSNAPRCR